MLLLITNKSVVSSQYNVKLHYRFLHGTKLEVRTLWYTRVYCSEWKINKNKPPLPALQLTRQNQPIRDVSHITCPCISNHVTGVVNDQAGHGVACPPITSAHFCLNRNCSPDSCRIKSGTSGISLDMFSVLDPLDFS